MDTMNIKGIAIRPGVSRNGITYGKEELDKFSLTMKGKPILIDHQSGDISKNVGLLQKSVSSNGVVNYEGWVKEHSSGLFERIQDGRLKNVSIGAAVERIVEDDKGNLIAEGMECMELSIVSCPGVKGTSLQQALSTEGKMPAISESFDINENMEDNTMVNEEPKVEEPVVEEPKVVEPVAEEPVVEEPVVEEPVTEEPAEVKKEESIKINVDSSDLDEALKKVAELTKAKESLKEKVKKVEDIKENTKGKVVKEGIKEEKVVSTITVEQCSYGEGVSLWKEPSEDGSYN